MVRDWQDYRQLAIKEIRAFLETDTEDVRLYFGSDTETCRQIKVICRQQGMKARDVVILAVRVLFLVLNTPPEEVQDGH